MKISTLLSSATLVLGAVLLNGCQTQSVALPHTPTFQLQQPQLPFKNITQPKQVLVKFLPVTTQTDKVLFHTEYNLQTLKIIPEIDVHVMTFLPGAPVASLQLLQNDARIAYIEVNGQVMSNPIKGVFNSMQDDVQSLRRLMGKKVQLDGIYSSTRAGARIHLDNGEQLSLVDENGNVLYSLPNIEEQRKVSIHGVISQAKGYNLTQSLGIRPLQITQK